MTKTIITNQFNAYKADCETTGQPIIMDEFVFAYIPGLDHTVDIDPNETLPADNQIVGRFPIHQKGKINNDAVVYSIILGTDIGPWVFNWVGLVNRSKNIVGVIQHTRSQEKLHNDSTIGQAGDTLVRNLVTPYKNAAQLTQITVDADVWQIDFTQRLKSIDERTRIENIDVYAQSSFIGEGWKVLSNNNQLTVQPGTGYIHGLRCYLAETLTLPAPTQFPTNVYLTASFHGHINGSHQVVCTAIEDPQELGKSYIENGITTYRFKISSLTSHSEIIDLRQKEWRQNHLNENEDPHPQYLHASDLVRATELKAGIAKIATLEQMNAGVDDSAFVTVKKLLQRVASTSRLGVVQLSNLVTGTSQSKAATEKAVGDVNRSLESLKQSDNPFPNYWHNDETASQAEAIAGTSHSRIMTALRSMEQLKSRISGSVAGTRSDYAASENVARLCWLKAVDAYNLASSKMTQAAADGRYWKRDETVSNSDKLDNLHASSFARSDHTHPPQANEVYKGTDPNNLHYPIGWPVIAWCDVAVGMINKNTTMYLSSNWNVYPLFASGMTASAKGKAISGTWKCISYATGYSGVSAALFVRVA